MHPRSACRHPRALSLAVRLAIAGTAFGLVAPGFAQDAPPGDTADPQKAKSLETVTVTGSRIRRVDVETANPVVTLDRAQIAATGKATLGDLVQELPSIAGNATNANTNNGGGTGAATISLRGMGDKRTLILVNGVRLAYNDVNSIPANMIDRVEVLSDGASAIYGSDAIGGVVNFILREHFSGVQLSGDFAQSSRSDGIRRNFALTAGQGNERGSIIAGLGHQSLDAVSARDRSFSHDALNLTGGKVIVSGSSATPYGSITLPSAQAKALGCSSRVALNPGVSGATTPGDYHCYGVADSYNYQGDNILQTPQKRDQFFVLGKYKLNDKLEAYANLYYTKTQSESQIAPVPVFANGDNFIVSKDNYYNPFGVDFGTDRVSGANNGDFNTRFTTLGYRRYIYNTYNLQVTPGLRGSFGDSSWQWDAAFNYGKVRQKSVNYGFLDYAGFQQGLGPSYLDASSGKVTCGTPGNPIAGCTPINIFNVNDPTTIAALKNIQRNPVTTTAYTVKQFEANANGGLFDLPAGTVNLATGFSYRKESTSTRTDPLAVADLNGLCGVVEFCSSVLAGSFNVKEAYAETLIPLLSGKPWAQALNLTLGARWSDYSSAGRSTNSKLAVEWRPIDNLLLRGTVSEVFRAPNINELYGGIAGDAPTVNDPCNGYTGGHPQACASVPTDGSYRQANPEISAKTSGSLAAGYQLKPEQGKSFDFGVVYDPQWVPGLSLSADVWRINLNDTITAISAQTVLNQCYANPASPFCSFIHRFASGAINYVAEPTVNLGALSTKGVDGSVAYRFNTERYGRFNLRLDTTYVARYDVNPDPSDATSVTIHNAGRYTYAYGNFPRWRGLATLNWAQGPWSASWRLRYVGRTQVGSPDARQQLSADLTVPSVVRTVGAYAYHSVQLGYEVKSWRTRFDIGVDNLADKQPPLMYQNNVNNSNTDVATYDVMGRYYWARATLTF
ncbi:TonB-dependent receptor [Dyella sp. LX-66]|uniref:TonB-dependent receptor plug domain-containing protein n=1 Tax=unclassified Dyella TaxID=2634549 RepID=UPI001BE03B51|nr:MULTISPECIES: TonB-dependent receptor [unclassified Dyella]MBT2118061.1 TonB-dependent receptor [Dyella sp. LX-1]MBT2140968.1 TonB-dependent receptor [Dyella sp. LX-66]